MATTAAAAPSKPGVEVYLSLDVGFQSSILTLKAGDCQFTSSLMSETYGYQNCSLVLTEKHGSPDCTFPSVKSVLGQEKIKDVQDVQKLTEFLKENKLILFERPKPMELLVQECMADAEAEAEAQMDAKIEEFIQKQMPLPNEIARNVSDLAGPIADRLAKELNESVPPCHVCFAYKATENAPMVFINPEEVYTVLIQTLFNHARARLRNQGYTVSRINCAVTLPETFSLAVIDTVKRLIKRSLKRIFMLADKMVIVRPVFEATAAAAHVLFSKDAALNAGTGTTDRAPIVAVFDIGHGSMNMAILQQENVTKYKTIASDCHYGAAGRDASKMIADFLNGQVKSIITTANKVTYHTAYEYNPETVGYTKAYLSDLVRGNQSVSEWNLSSQAKYKPLADLAAIEIKVKSADVIKVFADYNALVRKAVMSFLQAHKGKYNPRDVCNVVFVGGGALAVDVEAMSAAVKQSGSCENATVNEPIPSHPHTHVMDGTTKQDARVVQGGLLVLMNKLEISDNNVRTHAGLIYLRGNMLMVHPLVEKGDDLPIDKEVDLELMTHDVIAYLRNNKRMRIAVVDMDYPINARARYAHENDIPGAKAVRYLQHQKLANKQELCMTFSMPTNDVLEFGVKIAKKGINDTLRFNLQNPEDQPPSPEPGAAGPAR